MERIILILIFSIFINGCRNKEVDLIKQETAKRMNEFKILQLQNEINTKSQRDEIENLERQLKVMEAKGYVTSIIISEYQLVNARIELSLENIKGLKISEQNITDLETSYQAALNALNNVSDKEKIMALEERAAQIKSELEFKEKVYKDYYDNINEKKIVADKMEQDTRKNKYEAEKARLETKILLGK